MRNPDTNISVQYLREEKAKGAAFLIRGINSKRTLARLIASKQSIIDSATRAALS